MSSFIKKVLFAFLGVAILALGASILKKGGVGLDPYTAMNIGIGETIGLSLGIYQLLVNCVILLVIFFFDRSYIGVGTIINMVCAGFLIDFFSAMYDYFFAFHLTIAVQAVHLLIGVILFTFGASLYMSANLGTAPYDAIAPIIEERTKISYRTARIFQDVLVVIVAFIFGGPIGIGTVINAFFTGPLIDFWNNTVNVPLIKAQTVDKNRV